MRWLDSSGQRCRPNTPGATKHTETSRLYYAFGVISHSRRPIPLARTLAESRTKLSKILKGLASADRPRTLAQRLDDWRQTLALAGITRARQMDLIYKVSAILAAANVLQATELPAEAVRAVFSRWTDGSRRRWSVQTRSHYLKALNQFLRHAALPAIRIKLPVPRHHKILKRGALTLEQATRLLEGTRASSRVFRGLSGVQRERLYRLVLTTGLRRGELMILTDRHLHGLQIHLSPVETKNRQGAVLDLGPTLAAELASLRGLWFPGTWHDRSAKMVRLDLDESRVCPVERLDLHGLRHTYVTWCAQRWGVEVTQRLARHSTSVLTLDYYTHASPDHVAAAAGELENRLGCAKGVQPLCDSSITDLAGGSNSPKNSGCRAHLIGFEPITYGSEDHCSVQKTPKK